MQFFCPFLQIVGAAAKEFENNPGGVIFICEGMCLIGVYMHSKGVIRADPDYHIGKDQRAFIAFHDHKHIIVIPDIELDSLDGSHVDVPFGYDHTMIQLQTSGRADQRTAGSAFCLPRLTDHTRDSEFAGIGHGDLHLGFFTKRTKDGYILKGSFWSLYCKPLLADILAGLAQISFISKSAAFSKENMKILFTKMNVPGAGFDWYCKTHVHIPFLDYRIFSF